MMTDELKTMPKGQFIVMKTGAHPMKVKLKLFFKWGISFGEPYTVLDKGNRPVAYAGKNALAKAIRAKYPPPKQKQPAEEKIPAAMQEGQPAPEKQQAPQPDTKIRANAPTRRKTTPEKEWEDDRP